MASGKALLEYLKPVPTKFSDIYRQSRNVSSAFQELTKSLELEVSPGTCPKIATVLRNGSSCDREQEGKGKEEGPSLPRQTAIDQPSNPPPSDETGASLAIHTEPANIVVGKGLRVTHVSLPPSPKAERDVRREQPATSEERKENEAAAVAMSSEVYTDQNGPIKSVSAEDIAFVEAKLAEATRRQTEAIKAYEAEVTNLQRILGPAYVQPRLKDLPQQYEAGEGRSGGEGSLLHTYTEMRDSEKMVLALQHELKTLRASWSGPEQLTPRTEQRCWQSRNIAAAISAVIRSHRGDSWGEEKDDSALGEDVCQKVEKLLLPSTRAFNAYMEAKKELTRARPKVEELRRRKTEAEANYTETVSKSKSHYGEDLSEKLEAVAKTPAGAHDARPGVRNLFDANERLQQARQLLEAEQTKLEGLEAAVLSQAALFDRLGKATDCLSRTLPAMCSHIIHWIRSEVEASGLFRGEKRAQFLNKTLPLMQALIASLGGDSRPGATELFKSTAALARDRPGVITALLNPETQQESLMEAVCAGDRLKVLAALELGVPLNVESRVLLSSEGSSSQAIAASLPLHEAASRGFNDMVTLLLEHGADVDQGLNSNGVTALMLAAEGGHASTCDLLLGRGASISQENTNGWNAIVVAAHNGKAGVLQVFSGHLLKTQGACGGTSVSSPDPLSGPPNAHTRMSKGGSLEGGEVLKEDCWLTGLLEAAKSGHPGSLPSLLQRIEYVNRYRSDGSTLLVTAAEEGYYELCELLLQRGARVNQARKGDDVTPLIAAAQNNNIKICELLLEEEHGVNVEQETVHGSTALMVAAGKGHIEVCQLLIKAGANVRQARADGNCALLFASEASRTDVCQLLLYHGANPNCRCVDGWAPLMPASRDGNEALCRVLIDAGADVHVEFSEGNDGGDTPLMLAAQNGHTGTCRVLLQAGAKINQCHKIHGWTPLMFAARKNHAAVCELLLQHGADVKVESIAERDNCAAGSTVRDVAGQDAAKILNPQHPT